MSVEIVFIQIGANEGLLSTDPLSSLIVKEGWRGVLIEPVPRIFEKLKKNYAGYPGLYFENVAISDVRRVADFYVVDETADFFKEAADWVNEAGGPWGDLVGSLDHDHVLRCKPALSEKEVRKFQVQCVTLQDIVDKYQLSCIDVLQMDAEGHDAAILLSIDFAKIRPKVIVFEHVHMAFDQYFSCINHLQSHGYSVLHTGVVDTVVGIAP